MSLGYIGYCKKETEDNTAVIYTYSGADWNNRQRDRSADMAYDGELFISKNILNYTKGETKNSWIFAALKNGDVVINPCKNAVFRFKENIDYIALRCLYSISKHVYSDGVFPEKEAFIQ